MPQELIDEILGYLLDDPEDLIACSDVQVLVQHSGTSHPPKTVLGSKARLNGALKAERIPV